MIRWEWHPWLLLSGYKKRDMSLIDGIDRDATPCLVTDRVYRYNSELQMVQAKVMIYYGDVNIKARTNGFPIYEEFKFNSTGQLVFIGNILILVTLLFHVL